MGKGCLKVFGILVLAVLVLGLFSQCIGLAGADNDPDITPSTIERTPLSSKGSHLSYVSSDYVKDADGNWVSFKTTVMYGMRQFAEETGVQPYLYIAPSNSMTERSKLDAKAQQVYEERYSDERHFVLVFCDDSGTGFNWGYAVGSQAASVMDEEAVSVLCDYLNRYYHDSTVDADKLFSQAFSKTGSRIMEVTKPPFDWGALWLRVGICALIAVGVFAVLLVWGDRLVKQNKIKEALDAPIEKYSDEHVEELARKYEQEAPTERQTGEG